MTAAMLAGSQARDIGFHAAWRQTRCRRKRCGRGSRVRSLKSSGCRVVSETARPLGVFDCAAANEPGYRVQAAVYAVDVEGTVEPKAEIDEVIWVDPVALPDLPFARR